MLRPRPRRPALLVLPLAALLAAGCLGASDVAQPPSDGAPQADGMWNGSEALTGEPGEGSEYWCTDQVCIDVSGGAFPELVGAVVLTPNGTAAPGEIVTIRWELTEEVMAAEEVRVFYGTASVPDPDNEEYPESVEAWGDDVTLVMPPSGPLFARVAILNAGEDPVWSEERRFDPEGVGHRFDVTVPALVEAGVPFRLEVGVEGNVTDHAVFVDAALAPRSSLPSRGGFGRNDVNLTETFVGRLYAPGSVAGNVTLPLEGTWNLRPALHGFPLGAFQGSYGQEITVEVGPASTPRLALLTYLTDATEFCGEWLEVCADEEAAAHVALNGPMNGTTEVRMIAFPSSTREGEAPTGDPGDVVGRLSATSTGLVEVPFTVPAGDWFLRAYTEVDGTAVWSDEMRVAAVER